MKYLLDTCTVSDFVKGRSKVMERVKATPPNPDSGIRAYAHGG